MVRPAVFGTYGANHASLREEVFAASSLGAVADAAAGLERRPTAARGSNRLDQNCSYWKTAQEDVVLVGQCGSQGLRLEEVELGWEPISRLELGPPWAPGNYIVQPAAGWAGCSPPPAVRALVVLKPQEPRPRAPELR